MNLLYLHTAKFKLLVSYQLIAALSLFSNKKYLDSVFTNTNTKLLGSLVYKGNHG